MRKYGPRTKYFNPRSREGSDEHNAALCARPCNFNLRSREGSDVLVFVQILRRHDFNPRSREGSDLDEIADMTMEDISIHAPAKGANSPSPHWSNRSCQFQSTLP